MSSKLNLQTVTRQTLLNIIADFKSRLETIKPIHNAVVQLRTESTPEYVTHSVAAVVPPHLSCAVTLIDKRATKTRESLPGYTFEQVETLAATIADMMDRYLDPMTDADFTNFAKDVKFQNYLNLLFGAAGVAALLQPDVEFQELGEFVHSVPEAGPDVATVGRTKYYRVKPNVYVAINVVSCSFDARRHILAIQHLVKQELPAEATEVDAPVAQFFCKAN